jgi:hypothetical protein
VAGGVGSAPFSLLGGRFSIEVAAVVKANPFRDLVVAGVGDREGLNETGTAGSADVR